MRHKVSTLSLILTVGLILVSASAQAQTPGPQAALAQSVADLQKDPTDSALREKIIKLALGMKPAPAVPDEVKGFMASGTSLFTAAQAPDDFKKAAAEFEKARGSDALKAEPSRRPATGWLAAPPPAPAGPPHLEVGVALGGRHPGVAQQLLHCS
jgi:hypothetical protein